MNDEKQFEVNVRDEEFVEKSMYAICIEEEENRRFIIIFFIIALLLLIFIVIGFSFSMFDGSVTGPMTPITPSHGNVVFNYSDVHYGNDGIVLKNATAISDNAGKKLVGTGNVFDFSVSGNIYADGKIKYYIVLEENRNSTLEPEKVKVFLTSRNGVVEREVMNNVPTIASLKTKKINGVEYKVLYTKVLSGREKFNNEYSLRMWIKEDAEQYYGKKYSLKVNVFAEGVSD